MLQCNLEDQHSGPNRHGANTVERIIRTPDDDEPSAEIEHGLYLIRGDNVVVCGEIDEKMDGDIDWSKVKGEVIRDTKNA